MRRMVVLGIVMLLAAALAGSGWMRRATTTAGDGPRSDAAPPPTAGRPPRPRAAEPAATANLEPEAPRVVRGTVKDADGKPIADAEVALLDGLPSDRSRRLATSRTAADGTFEFPSNGGRVVQARKDGYAPRTRLTSGGGDVDLLLERGAGHELLVVDERGAPIAGAEIRLYGDDDATTTDRGGRARLVAQDQAGIVIRARGFATESDGVAAIDDRDGVHRIVLREGRTISGVVVDGDGKPMSTVSVELSGWDDHGIHGADGARQPTGPDGAFVFDGLPSDPVVSIPREFVRGPVPWRLRVDQEGLATTPVFATPGQTDVRLVVRRPATVRGIVVDADGRPVRGASVAWSAGDSDVQTDDDGTFELTRTPPGRQTITASEQATDIAWERWTGTAVVDVPEGGTIDGVRITLRHDAANSYVLVHLVDADSHLAEGVGATVWIDGVVSDAVCSPDEPCLVDAPPGTSVVVTACSVDGRTSAAASVVTRASWPTDPVELRLGPVGTLRLRLVDADDRDVPLDRAEIDVDGDRNADGSFPLAAGSLFQASIYVPGFADCEVVFAPPQPATRDVVVRLTPAVRIVGRVVAAGGGPPRTSLRAGVRGDRWGRSYEFEADGRFEIASLPPGRAWLVVESSYGRAAVWRDVDLVAGAPIDLGDLVVPPFVMRRFLVVDADGRALGGALATFLDPIDSGLNMTTSRADGTFDAELPIGFPARVLVRRRGFATTFVEPSVDGVRRIVLRPAGAVRVSTSAVADFGPRHVEATTAAGRWTPLGPADGRAAEAPIQDGDVLDDLPPGAVELALVTPKRRLTKTVEVVAGKTVDCVFGD